MRHIAGTIFAVAALAADLQAQATPAKPAAAEPQTAGGETMASLPSGPGGVSQPLDRRPARQIHATDYGAKCDGVTDDTAALDAAYKAAAALRATLFMPNATCLTTGNAVVTPSYSAQFAIIGFGRNQTILKKIGHSAAPVLTLGSSSAKIYTANVEIGGITFDGSTLTTRAALESYDLVRSHIHDVQFTNSDVGYMSYGGIANSIDNAVASRNRIGMRFTRFASAANAGYPNLNRITGSQIVDNHEWGIWFDHGRMLLLKGDEIEGNGTTLGAAQGGLYVGPNIGSEVAVTAPESQGVIVEDAWFESNSGTADALFDSGINVIRGAQFFSTARQVAHDIQINAGRYQLENVNSAFPKTANLVEGGAVRGGNIITLSNLGNLSYDRKRTSLFNGSAFGLREGQVPAVRNIETPTIETGSDQSSDNPTITFKTPFKDGTIPRVYTQIVDNDQNGINQVDIYDVSSRGFKARKKYLDRSTIEPKNYQISWMAIGEAP